MNQESSRLIFSDIIRGNSSTNHSFYNQLYLKHLSYLEIGSLDIQYQTFLEQATKQGIPRYEQRAKDIISDGLWTNDEELELYQYEKIISDIRINISRDYLVSRRRKLRSQIEEMQQSVAKLQIKKNHYIGQTVEEYANKKLTYHKILNSYYTDRQCKTPLITDIDEEIKDEYYYELIDLYNKFEEKFGGNNIRDISISPFFTSMFYLSNDDVYSFYGKPVIDLTVYQADLFSFGKYFKSVLSNRADIPAEIRNKPEELMEWIEVNRAADEAKIFGDDDNSKGGAMSIPQATKEDLSVLGVQQSSKMSNVAKKLKESPNKTLNAAELFSMTG